MKKSWCELTGMVALLGASSLNVFAQTPPGAIPLGPMMAYPEIEVGLKRDDNISMQPSATRQADTITSVKPSVRLEAKQGVNLFDVAYRGEYLRFNQSAVDSVENHEVAANGNLTFDARNNLKLRLQYQDRFDPRGSLISVNTPSPNQYHQSTASGLYTYGAEDAQGKLEFQGGYYSKAYVSNRTSTAGLDHDRSELGGTFLWRVQPKTFATLTLRQYEYDYATTTTLNSKDTFFLVGARWDATAATSGRFSFGRQTKKFDSAGVAIGRKPYGGTSWEGGVKWSPLSYSSVDFTTNRSTTDSTGLGDFGISQNNQAVWTHAWTSSISSNLTAGYATSRFSSGLIAGAGSAERLDKNTTLGLRVNYAIQRWLKAGADWTNTERNTNATNSDYKRNVLMFFLAATL